MTISPLPKLSSFPRNLPLDGAVRMELVEGVPIFRAASVVQTRIEALLIKQQDFILDMAEEEELNCYEEIDDYLSFVNRIVQNNSSPVFLCALCLDSLNRRETRRARIAAPLRFEKY